MVLGPRKPSTDPPLSERREALWRVIFQSDTTAGRAFDLGLLVCIIVSVFAVMMESVQSFRAEHGELLRAVEWFFTSLFTVELLLRLWVCRRPLRYLFSFFGIVDLISIVPTYLALFIAGPQYMATIRVLRLLRMFRVLKMAHHIGEAGILMNAIEASRAKIAVFLVSVMTMVCVEGTIIYVVEGPYNDGFSSIPQSIYWAIVTITTVGYGDISPVTPLGKMVASLIMLTGFAILAVPTGVVTAELGKQMRSDRRKCRECGWEGHDPAAQFCMHCGTEL